MGKKNSKEVDAHPAGRRLGEEFRGISHKIQHYANRGLPRIDFAREVAALLIDFSGCDSVELRLKRHDRYFRCETTRNGKPSFRFEQLPCSKTGDGKMIPCSRDDSALESLCRDIMLGRIDHSLPFFTEKGGFYTGNARTTKLDHTGSRQQSNSKGYGLGGNCRSLALFPLVIDEENVGLLQLKSRRKDYFTGEEIEFYEGLAQMLGVALAHRSAQVGLRERIKELTCLYGIAQLSARPAISLEEILQGIVELLPPAWLYPEMASARIILEECRYTTPGFQEKRQMQTAEIVVSGQPRGIVQVAYAEEMPELDEGPFLRHADRLATIGQLAAGVAHELNEPLGHTLGFAQLAQKCPGLPKQAEEDIEKTVIASMHAREVVKKLMLFARPMPPKKTQVNLNQLVEEGLYFLESRCAKEGIKLVRSLSLDLPEITADPGQLTQVLVNLVVNAVQAMPDGGKLTVETHVGDGYISLTVEDTGVGMSDKVAQKIFMPFFTTKDVDQGTGLGLAVVHGIVTSHGGSIKVDSKVGRGTRFEVKLPLAGAPDVEETE
jgi:signal transduction histidine kinase